MRYIFPIIAISLWATPHHCAAQTDGSAPWFVGTDQGAQASPHQWLSETPREPMDADGSWLFDPDQPMTLGKASFERHLGICDRADSFDLGWHLLVRGQSPSGGGSSGGAPDATDPSAILTQLQIQNVFTPESYGASGYANTAIIQPVLPFPVAMPGVKEFFPHHIVRPTLPFPAPMADPDGPAGVVGGMGDLTLLDIYVHQIEGFGTAAFGYNAVFPTSTRRQLGRGEWQLGPAALLIYKEIPKTLLGALVTTQYSFQSDAQQINAYPVALRHLQNGWYIRWGEIFWTFDTDTGDYHIPINIAVGKVIKDGRQPLNVFLEPFYTPAGLHSGPGGDKWGVKLNVTFLFPEKNLKPLLGCLWGECEHDN